MERHATHVETFPARMSAVPAVTAFTARACLAAGLAQDACLRLTLLVEELFPNTVAHGHGHDSEAPVRVVFDVAPGRVELLYEDTGPAHAPFAAVAAPDDTAEVEERLVGGLSLVLNAALASEVQLSARGRQESHLARHRGIGHGIRLTGPRGLC
jgi:anti-sigma regulatory factor (Ser/Thr protein kinase)